MPQGTIKVFDKESRSGSLVTDEGVELTYDAVTFDTSRLLELRIGQRVRFDVDGESVSNLQIVSL